MSNQIPHIIQDSSITVIVNGEPITIPKSDNTYYDVVEAIKERDWEEVERLSNKIGRVKEFVKGKLELKGNTIFYDGEEVHGHVVNRIVNFVNEGLDAEPLLKFLEKLMSNPSKRCVDDLYKFLEQGNMPIDPDGDFYAYKAVRPNWKDKHSGKIDNSVGSIVEVARNKVDDNPDHGCSHGLHAGSIEYVKGFGGPGDKMIIVKINPADVVSVPSHDVRKLRCCKYEVTQEYEGILPETTYESADDGYDDYDDEYDEYLD